MTAGTGLKSKRASPVRAQDSVDLQGLQGGLPGSQHRVSRSWGEPGCQAEKVLNASLWVEFSAGD